MHRILKILNLRWWWVVGELLFGFWCFSIFHFSGFFSIFRLSLWPLPRSATHAKIKKERSTAVLLAWPKSDDESDTQGCDGTVAGHQRPHESIIRMSSLGSVQTKHTQNGPFQLPIDTSANVFFPSWTNANPQHNQQGQHLQQGPGTAFLVTQRLSHVPKDVQTQDSSFTASTSKNGPHTAAGVGEEMQICIPFVLAPGTEITYNTKP